MGYMEKTFWDSIETSFANSLRAAMHGRTSCGSQDWTTAARARLHAATRCVRAAYAL